MARLGGTRSAKRDEENSKILGPVENRGREEACKKHPATWRGAGPAVHPGKRSSGLKDMKNRGRKVRSARKGFRRSPRSTLGSNK